ncbi:MAG: hypothetical protein KF802_15170 [Bdellovibrionaceae bacterium]|nr:hypothetical protein [Pseudobdellovibrionaceae bacterium]MBX3033427.1 hypothetical protein [Pseudobdellovibrionaceae bacterium]
MTVVRLVTQDESSNLVVSGPLLQKMRCLLWRDPVQEEILRALAHRHRVCPVIETWRQRHDGRGVRSVG